jgi:hypothetical protein
MVAAADLWNGQVAFAGGLLVRKCGLEQYAIAPGWGPLRRVREAWLSFLNFECWREVDAAFSEACVDAASCAFVGQLVERQQLLEALMLYGITQRCEVFWGGAVRLRYGLQYMRGKCCLQAFSSGLGAV